MEQAAKEGEKPHLKKKSDTTSTTPEEKKVADLEKRKKIEASNTKRLTEVVFFGIDSGIDTASLKKRLVSITSS